MVLNSHRRSLFFKKYRPLLVPALLVVLVILILLTHKQPKKALISPVTGNYEVNIATNSFDFNDLGLSKIIERDLKDSNGNYAIVVESLNSKSKFRYYHNENTAMPAASLYKLFLLAAAFDQINQGKLAKNDLITASESHLIDVLGSKEFGYEDMNGDSVTYSVSEIIKRISTISDNYAAIMLAEKIGWGSVRAEAQKIGMHSTSISSPITTSADDVALFFEKLYQKQIVSPQVSSEIIELLSSSRINNRIPNKLPPSLKIAHKTGELPLVRNDAGIVFLDKNPYIIVLLSKDLQYEDDGVETLSQISGDVYTYFNSQSDAVHSTP